MNAATPLSRLKEKKRVHFTKKPRHLTCKVDSTLKSLETEKKSGEMFRSPIPVFNKV